MVTGDISKPKLLKENCVITDHYWRRQNNERGDRLINFLRDVIISKTLFENSPERCLEWTSSGNRVEYCSTSTVTRKEVTIKTEHVWQNNYEVHYLFNNALILSLSFLVSDTELQLQTNGKCMLLACRMLTNFEKFSSTSFFLNASF